MTNALRTNVFGAFAAVGLTMLFAGSVSAQGRSPQSLQPDLFITIAMDRNTPVAHGNVMLLPSANHHAAFVRGNGRSARTAPGVTNALTLNTNLYLVGPTVTPTTSEPEAEEEITADPSDSAGNNLVAAISDFSSPSGFNFTKWVLSSDGGNNWSENFVPYDQNSGLLLTSDGRSWSANSDPVVTFDRSGNVYLSDLYITVDAFGRITSEGLYVSTDSFNNLKTANFGHTYRVRANLNNKKTFSLEDKPWIAVDNSSTATAGYVYASWAHFTGCQNKGNIFTGFVLTCSSDVIYLAYSKNHGQSWSSPVAINPSGQNNAVQGAQVAVGPDGKVYVAYEFFGSGDQRRQYLAVGTWSGSTLQFSPSFAVTPFFSDLNFAGCVNCLASYRVNSFPNIAVGPGGAVYIVYGAQVNSTSTAQVNFVACTSGCTSSGAFSAPSIVNDVADGDHFFPAIAADQGGAIHTSWFDTRLNPSNPDYLDVWAASITYSGGVFTVSQNKRVTTATNDASIGDIFGDTSFIGDYLGIAATAETSPKVHPVWTNASGLIGELVLGSLQTATLTP
jgi:hypothetical protein